MEEIDLFLASDDSMPPGIEIDGYDSEGDIRFLEELLSNDSPPLPENESFSLDYFDDSSLPRPLPEPPDVEICFNFEPDAGVVTKKVVGDISEHDVLMPNLLLDNFLFPLPESDDFTVDVKPVADVTNKFDVLNKNEPFDPGGGKNVVFLNVEEDDSFTFTIRTFLPFVTYPDVSPLLSSTKMRIPFLTVASPLRAGGLSSGWNFHVL
ncbi:hypothetical protein Tco_1543016 [Tanacetum coccineum]